MGLDAGLRWALVAVVALAPLPFGAAPVWAWAGVTLALAVLTAVWGAAMAAGRLGWHAAARPGGVAYPLGAAVVLWAGVQAVPGLPGAHPAWESAAQVLADVPAGTIAAAPDRTRHALARLAAPVLAALLALHLGGDARGRARVLMALAAAAGVWASYGLLEMAAGWNAVLGVDKPAYRAAATAPFLNRNAFAAYTGVGALAAAGPLAARLRREGAGRALERAWPLVALLAVLLAAVIASRSRGGVGATAAGFAVFALAAPGRGWPAARRLGWVAGAGLVGVAALAALRRWSAVGVQLAERLRVYEATVVLIAERPWLGHGAGAFAAVFPGVRPPGLGETFVHAHSVPLQAAAMLGIPAALTALAAVACLGAACWRAARGGSVAGRVGVSALALAAAHGLLDFAPQVPGVAVTLGAVIGLGAARPHRAS